MGLATAGLVGVGFAGGLGALIARRAIAPLGHAIARQQRFVADASHELRTPLTRLHTRAQLLGWELRSDPDTARVRADVEQLVRGTRQMGEVVEELLVAAQLRVEPQRYAAVDLRPLAEQVAESERPRAAGRRVTVDVVDMFGVVDAAGPVVGGAGTSLRRVLSSLVDNALSHSPDGGRIAIELAPADRGFIEVRVRDDGVGFDPTTAERMFQRFYRGDHGGARRFGLGLALVREVVTAHGGTVTAQATPRRGACFVVRLPAWTGELTTYGRIISLSSWSMMWQCHTKRPAMSNRAFNRVTSSGSATNVSLNPVSHRWGGRAPPPPVMGSRSTT
jgi:two-component system, OmpR family, sensor kinase